MANFQPFNNYSIFILNRMIRRYHLKPPFLDIASGTGYLSKYLGSLGWPGKAIDSSKKAVEILKSNLKKYQYIDIERKDFFKLKGQYNTIFMFDILEHIRNDSLALRKVYSLLSPNGYLVITVPSNYKEWRWDDNFYGHLRRYTKAELKEKLTKTGFIPMIYYDYSFPFFWLLRRVYTKILNKSEETLSTDQQTKQSSFSNAWHIPVISSILDHTSFLWFPVYFIQYTLFKTNISKGNAIIVLATKNKDGHKIIK